MKPNDALLLLILTALAVGWIAYQLRAAIAADRLDLDRAEVPNSHRPWYLRTRTGARIRSCALCSRGWRKGTHICP